MMSYDFIGEFAEYCEIAWIGKVTRRRYHRAAGRNGFTQMNGGFCLTNISRALSRAWPRATPQVSASMAGLPAAAKHAFGIALLWK